jgi:hypothetical protein
MMRRALLLTVFALGVSTASSAAAEPRDSVDRGNRLDTNAIRDDVGTNRLKVPSHPLIIVPPQQPAPTSKGSKSRKPTTAGSR